MRNLKVTGLGGLLLFGLTACATTYINPSTGMNPPPSEKFSAFSKFELAPVQLAQAYSTHSANQHAAQMIQQQMDVTLKQTITAWNLQNPNGPHPRTLKIEPRIEQVKFISTSARIWSGALAGGSAVLMRVRYTDTANGSIVAEPEFFQRANAVGAAWTFGATDRNMLERIAGLVNDYTIKNYQQAVGGPTSGPQGQ